MPPLAFPRPFPPPVVNEVPPPRMALALLKNDGREMEILTPKNTMFPAMRLRNKKFLAFQLVQELALVRGLALDFFVPSNDMPRKFRHEIDAKNARRHDDMPRKAT